VLVPSMAGQAVDPKSNNKRLKLKKKWDAFWQSNGGYDVMLCPVTPTAAITVSYTVHSRALCIHVYCAFTCTVD
jgi:Asp-tRNA(Asn)/Glu-tRNA(Gln) amidotransferase A subunit family amidase